MAERKRAESSKHKGTMTHEQAGHLGGVAHHKCRGRECEKNNAAKSHSNKDHSNKAMDMGDEKWND